MGSISATTYARTHRRLVSLLCAGAMAFQTACYTYAPIAERAPAQPRDVGLVINDRGRVLLGDRVGAIVDRIDGRVISVDSANVRLSVHRVTDLRGNASTWTGEEVTIPREAILGYRERKISKFKTFLVVGAIALALVATLGMSLDVFGDGRSDTPPDPPVDR